MRLTAKDSFFTDETGQVRGGQNFEVESEETAKEMIKRGLAEESEEVNGAPENKAAPKPANKAEAKPSVKIASAAKGE